MDSQQQGVPASVSPANTQGHRPLTGAATVATALILLELVREVLVSVGNWRGYYVVHDYLTGAATEADLRAADSDALAKIASWPSLVVWFAAGVAFLVWLWRARINVELMSGADSQRRSRGWVIGAWTVPAANLWYPYQVVTDIWRASAPRLPASIAVISAWWAAFVGALVVRPIQWRLATEEATSEQDLLNNANVSTLLAALLVMAGVLVIVIIRRITAWQTQAARADSTQKFSAT
ncbi:DUF4328 domain-containing protein [Streptomyces sp. NPDC001415]